MNAQRYRQNFMPQFNGSEVRSNKWYPTTLLTTNEEDLQEVSIVLRWVQEHLSTHKLQASLDMKGIRRGHMERTSCVETHFVDNLSGLMAVVGGAR